VRFTGASTTALRRVAGRRLRVECLRVPDPQAVAGTITARAGERDDHAEPLGHDLIGGRVRGGMLAGDAARDAHREGSGPSVQAGQPAYG
jgi:hypothetical protein